MISLTNFYIIADNGDPPAVQIHIDTEPLNRSTTHSNADEWPNVEDTSTDDILTNNTSLHSSSPSLLPDLMPPMSVSPGDTRPNTPVNLHRGGEQDYHIIYRCDTHGQQNHYGPYCRCTPSEIDINMPPRLPDGTLPPILADGSIPWSPRGIPAKHPIASNAIPPNTSEAIPPDYIPVAGPLTQAAAVAGLSNATPPPLANLQAGPFYVVTVGARTGIFDDW